MKNQAQPDYEESGFGNSEFGEDAADNEKAEAMDDEELVAIIEQQESYARSGGRLLQERIDAIDSYLGRPYGDEEEGRSTVVMRDVADTVEWIKPSLMKVFCSGDEVVTFNPFGAEDEQQAEQETDYCNHVLMQKNEGFMILHDWFHDALLQKNGYVLCTYEKRNKRQKDRFEGLTDDEFALMAQGLGETGAEIVEHTEKQVMGGMGPVAVHDVVIQRMQERGALKMMNIPPERVLIAPDWPGVTLKGCPFVEVIDFKTISELRQDGYDVDDDISDTGREDDRYVEQHRRVTMDRIEQRQDIQADVSTRRLRTRYVWMLIDQDGDGEAELRRLVIVGTTILCNEEDDLIPVACCTPYRIPHEHNGLSVHDIVQDIQRIRTALIRGFLDNMYLVNNPRYGIDATQVNIDDMLNPRPGGLVRVGGPPGAALQPLVHPADGPSILGAVEYIDTVRENRTGVTKYNQGLDANSLNKTLGGISQIMSASQQRIELIARVIAETGMKSLMWIIHAMSIKHGRQTELVKLRNQWVPVDPSKWQDREDMTVSVGLGTGNKDQMLGHLQLILAAQQQAVPMGLARPKNIYNALVKLTQNAGFKMPDEFWTDPDEAQPMPQPPNPEMIKAQAAQQLAQAKSQADMQMHQEKLSQEAQIRQIELMAEASEKEKDRQTELEKVRIQAAVQIELARIGAESAMESKIDDRQYAEGQQAQAIATEQQNKQQLQQDALAPVLAEIQQIVAALNRPMSVVRGPDGRAAEIH